MQLIQAMGNFIHNTFFNFDANMSAPTAVDARDLGMVARYNRQYNPLDGWGLFILELVNKETKAHDAFKVTEEGFTYYEVRLIDGIQSFFRERTQLVVTRETIYKMEREAHAKADYYTQLATLCMNYEADHAPNQTPIHPIVRTFN